MYSTKIMQLELDQERPYVITIKALLDDSSNYFTRIGSFNFLYNEGSIKQFNGTYREVKRFSTILNHFAKHNESFMWNSNVVDQAKLNAKAVKKQEKNEAEAAAKQLQVERANDLLTKLNNKDESLNDMVSSLQELTDSEILERINNTLKNKINEELANKILLAIQSYFTKETAQTNIIDIPQQEQFHLYNNTFTSYKEAFNYACEYQMDITMILSSNHSTMTNERLKYLSNAYIFSKTKMSYDEITEYYNYLATIPESRHQQERLYKLKSLIDRYNYQKEQEYIQKKRSEELMKEAYETLLYMQDNGLVIDSKGDSTKYLFNGEPIHTWYGYRGLSAIEYHDMITNMYDNHFKQT